ncbi:HD domain-containing protein [[Mycoplasma] cavipharyngis]|uniref:HD domain-containing protein n=1 Tax=[Mycoplasma] cavipharyngis TaxID=92757 RepID=UPI003704C100
MANKRFYSKLHLEINNKKKLYFIKDAIHHEISFDQNQLWIYQLVNTPEIQRLGKILQLSLSFNNFPTATHTRLSHSLGVYYVTNQFIQEFIRRKILDPDHDRLAINIALVAALLHDVGHGPHSHAFELYTNYNHEFFATKILRSKETQIHQILVEKAINDHLDEDFYIEHIIKIINKKNDDPNLRWVQDLISSQLDADRLDYLLRDSYFSGIDYGKNKFDLLIKWSIIVRDQHLKNNSLAEKKQFLNKIAFYQKANYLITDFLINRFLMHAELYTNSYSTIYENLISLIIKIFKQNYQTIIDDPQLQPFIYFYQLLKPYLLESPNQFNYQQFLKLTDETFNIILDSFCQASHPDLKSLTNLLHGNISQSEHQYLILKLDQFADVIQIMKKLNLDQQNTNAFLSFDNTSTTVVYDKKQPILNYNIDSDLILLYNDFLERSPINLKKLKKFELYTNRKIVIINKKLWKTIQQQLQLQSKKITKN